MNRRETFDLLPGIGEENVRAETEAARKLNTKNPKPAYLTGAVTTCIRFNHVAVPRFVDVMLNRPDIYAI